MKRSDCHMIFALMVLSFGFLGWEDMTTFWLPHRNLRVSSTMLPSLPYSQKEIMDTAKHFTRFSPRLLVFDGTHFQAFSINHKDTPYSESMKRTYRYSALIPFLIRCLREQFPQRFQPGQPVFQLLFHDGDSPHSPCVNEYCPVDTFSPLLMFGSSPKNASALPTIQIFPNTYFMLCLIEFKAHGIHSCQWPHAVTNNSTSSSWESLIDTLVWRGSDYPFLEYYNEFHFDGPDKLMEHFRNRWRELTKEELLQELQTTLDSRFPPRWRAVLQSSMVENETTPWIDAKFVAGYHGNVYQKLADKGIHMIGQRIESQEMSKYKYQVDFGGGGGTSWEGTLLKLSMPGVLFHHETPTKDWFYDLMVPWKHYIPIDNDIHDMRNKWEFAQSNPKQIRHISEESSELAQFLLSDTYMEKVYQDLFVHYLGKLVRGFIPDGFWSTAKATYEENGYELLSIATCDDLYCNISCEEDKNFTVSLLQFHYPLNSNTKQQ